jgi:LPXTG-motif cell wall-anchored protein
MAQVRIWTVMVDGERRHTTTRDRRRGAPLRANRFPSVAEIPGARAVRLAVALLLSVLVSLVVVSTTSTTAAAAGVPISCGTGSVYAVNQDAPFNLTQVSTTTGTATLTAVFNTPPAAADGFRELNGLAIAPGGTAAYAASNYRTTSGTISIQKYDPATGAVTTVGTMAMATGLVVVGGAIDPTTGLYWLMVYNLNNGWYEFYAFNTATNTSLGRQFSYPWNFDLSLNGNGDLAFDATGRLYVLMSDGATRSQIRMWEPPLPSGNQSASSGVLLASPVGTVTVQSNGIAFGADGYLYAESLDGPGGQARIRKIDPTTGLVVGSPVGVKNPNGTANTNAIDLASCAMPSTLTLQKDIVGRKVATDQFALSITGNGVSRNNTAVTSGSTTGLQTAAGEIAGPVLAIPGKTYTITETGSSGANLANYTISYQCVDTLNNNAVVATGTTASGSVTMPAPSATGANVVCTIKNTPLRPDINIVKAPGSVTGPDASGVYTANYTVTVTNSGTASGTYGPLLDTPAFDPNYTAQSASWTGQTSGSATGAGPFTLAPSGTSIGVGVTHTYNVAIKFKYTGSGGPTACDGSGTGLYNSVSATGETGPSGDNNACDAPPSSINITKTGGSVSGPDASGNYTVTYTIKVINVGSAGDYGALIDTPSFSSNIVPDRATWTTSGPGAPAGGTDATIPYNLTTSSTAIAANTTHTFVVTITFHFSDTDPPTACGGADTGLFNEVAAASGETGPTSDNSACVQPPTRYDVFLRKVGQDADGSTVSLAGSTWQLQADANGTPGAVITGGIQPVSGETGEFKLAQLQPGTYWLTETKAPTGYVLLAEPIRFVVSTTGAVSVTSGGGGTVSVGSTSGGQPEIIVKDPRPLALPLTGGSGTTAVVLGGGALLVLAVVAALMSVRRRRSRAGERHGVPAGE